MVFRTQVLGCGPGPGLPAATHFLLLRQKKVSKEKATLAPASLRCATGNLRCSVQPGSKTTRFAQTSFCPDPSGPALLGASTRGNRERGQKTEIPKTNTNKDSLWRVLFFCLLCFWRSKRKASCRRATPGQQSSEEGTPPEQDPAPSPYCATPQQSH